MSPAPASTLGTSTRTELLRTLDRVLPATRISLQTSLSVDESVRAIEDARRRARLRGGGAYAPGDRSRVTAVLRFDASPDDERITTVEVQLQLKWPEAIRAIVPFWVAPAVFWIVSWFATRDLHLGALMVLVPLAWVPDLAFTYDINRIEHFIRGALPAPAPAVPASHPYRGAPTRPA